MAKQLSSSNSKIELSSITTYQSGVVQSTAYRMLKKITDKHLKPHGLTTMQWFVIGMIYDEGKGGIRITDLAAKVDTTLSFLTHTINLLEARGIVERVTHSTDNRAKMVTVSKEFRPKCKEIEADLRQKLRGTLYGDITPEELQVYITVLYKFASLKV